MKAEDLRTALAEALVELGKDASEMVHLVGAVTKEIESGFIANQARTSSSAIEDRVERSSNPREVCFDVPEPESAEHLASGRCGPHEVDEVPRIDALAA